jgi:hypothetical protein
VKQRSRGNDYGATLETVLLKLIFIVMDTEFLGNGSSNGTKTGKQEQEM